MLKTCSLQIFENPWTIFHVHKKYYQKKQAQANKI